VSGSEHALAQLAARVRVRVLGAVGGERLRVVSPRASTPAASAASRDRSSVEIDVPLEKLAAAHARLGELFD
jgi:hypothetical protein